ncbi:MAG: peptide ABC transporter substrate-binding protein, partial [Caldilineaceae bacterium]|nr:peptide ABC transporter substrate-binding protein [Caldilineaceae bacterium]
VQRQAAQIGRGIVNTQYNYDYQPVLQDGFSTLEDGLATNEMVAVAAGDMVYNADGEPEELQVGTMVMLNGEPTAWDGASELELPQLVVTYKLLPYTWSDGTPGSIEDVELGFQINCDKESGATSFITCESIQGVEYGDGLEYTVTYLPGVQDPTYYLAPFSIGAGGDTMYPSHQVVSDGRLLKDVPGAEWQTLPEVAETPLSFGAFYISEWAKGERIVFERNPYWEGDVTGINQIVIVFVEDTNQAVAQLLNGDVDFLERATLGGGAEVQTLIDAADQGKVNVEILPSPTWEHIDMNLFTK